VDLTREALPVTPTVRVPQPITSVFQSAATHRYVSTLQVAEFLMAALQAKRLANRKTVFLPRTVYANCKTAVWKSHMAQVPATNSQ
jgi:hypothetical protein